MAVTTTVYANYSVNVDGGTGAGGTPIDYLTDTIKAALVTSAYTPNSGTHDFWDDVSANELATGNGYTTGGNALASKTTTLTAGHGFRDAADPTWTFSASKSFAYVVFYKDTGTASTSPLICYVDLGGTQTTSGTFTLILNASGLIQIG